MSCYDGYEVDEAVARGVHDLHDRELFLELDIPRIQQLMWQRDAGELYLVPTELRSVVEAHLREVLWSRAVEPTSVPPDQVVAVSGPKHISDLAAVIDVDVSAAITADSDPELVHVAGVMIEPESYDERVGCFNEALAIVGYDRRFVRFRNEEFFDSLYLLVTDEQRDVLIELGLASFTPALPRRDTLSS